MDRALRFASVVAVILLGIPPALELRAVAQPTQHALAAAILVLAEAAGIYAAIRRTPLGLRATTAAYGAFGIGLGLFASDRSIAYLLAYVVGLIGMNVLAYHARAFGPVLAAFTDEDLVSRRARAVAVRSLAVSGGALAAAYGASLALLPVFTIDVGSTDPVVALLTAILLIGTMLLLALLPETSVRFFDRVRAHLR